MGKGEVLLVGETSSFVRQIVMFSYCAYFNRYEKKMKEKYLSVQSNFVLDCRSFKVSRRGA